MKVNSRRQTLCYHLAISLLEFLRLFHNPNGMERGDKRLGLSDVAPGPEGVPRTHYFRADEVPADARAAGMSVVQQTTVKSIMENPAASNPRLYHRGDLIYVLRKD